MQFVAVDDERLAKALFCLSEQRREIILLYYFLHYKDYQLAALLDVQAYHKPRIAYLSHGDTELQELLNTKLLEAVLKFRMDYPTEK